MGGTVTAKLCTKWLADEVQLPNVETKGEREIVGMPLRDYLVCATRANAAFKSATQKSRVGINLGPKQSRSQGPILLAASFPFGEEVFINVKKGMEKHFQSFQCL